MPHRVGTLDTLRLAVYENGDGAVWFRDGGVRVKVHGNTRWTTSSGEARRGQVHSPPYLSRQNAWNDSGTSGSGEGSGDDDQEEDEERAQLARAIAASLAQHSVPNGGESPVNEAALDQMGDEEQMQLAIAASLATDSGGGGSPNESAPAAAQVDPVAPSPAPAAPTCSICMEELRNGGQAVQALHCSHAFHRSCIQRWLATNRSCPTCRQRA